MEQILENIEYIPGINGVYYYNTSYGTIAKKTGSNFTDKDLAIVGETLVKIHAEGSKAFSDIDRVSLYYKEANLIIYKVTSENFLVIIHDRKLNRNLMNMTVAQALQDLKSKNGYIPKPALKRTKTQSTDEAPPPSGLKGNTTASDVDEKVSLNEVLREMENKLKQIMGPTATIIFQETLALWKKQGNVGPETISAFALLLYTKINDPEKINTYKVLIAPNLRAFE